MIKIQDFEMDAVNFAAQGNAVLGIRDSGKTYTATWFAERLLDAHIPFVAFDPIGVWRYLRIGTKGNEGYKIVVAGENADLPLTAETAPNIVRAAMQENIPLVIDLYSMHLTKAQWKKIVEESVRLLLYENKQYGLRHIFIEEAAEFCPQRVGPDQGRVYAEIEKLARMGRNASLGYTLINQRAEEVNKAVLELCDCLILHRQKGRHSLTALDKWLSIADTTNTKEIVKSLPMLPQGHCWIWQAGSNLPVLVEIPNKRTTHPDPKKPELAKSSLASVDVSQFIKRLNQSLDQQVKDKKTEKTASQKQIQVQAENTQDELLRKQNDDLRQQLVASQRRERLLTDRLNAVRVVLEPQYRTFQLVFEHMDDLSNETQAAAGQYEIWLGKLQGKQRDMLEVLIQRKRVTRSQLGLLIGMSANGGGFRNYLSKLTTLGLAKREGDEVVLQEMQ